MTLDEARRIIDRTAEAERDSGTAPSHTPLFRALAIVVADQQQQLVSLQRQLATVLPGNN